MVNQTGTIVKTHISPQRHFVLHGNGFLFKILILTRQKSQIRKNAVGASVCLMKIPPEINIRYITGG